MKVNIITRQGDHLTLTNVRIVTRTWKESSTIVSFAIYYGAIGNAIFFDGVKYLAIDDEIIFDA